MLENLSTMKSDLFYRVDTDRKWYQPPKFASKRSQVWESGYIGSGYFIQLDKDTPFDSSVPWFLWFIMSPSDPRFLFAAWVHDTILNEGKDRVTAASDWFHGARAGGAKGLLPKLGFVAVAFWAVFKPGSYRKS